MASKASMIVSNSTLELTNINNGSITPNTAPLTLIVIPLITELLLRVRCTGPD